MAIRLKVRQARLDYQQRIGRPVSIQEVADAIGVSRAALSNIELGKSWPGKEIVDGLCRIYDVGVNDLVEYTQDAEAKTAKEEESGNSMELDNAA